MTSSSSLDRSLVQAQFGANASKYSTSTVHAKGASLKRVVELVAPERHWSVLDIATGAGHMALAFAPHVTSVVASDVTQEMLDEVVKNATSAQFNNIATAMADAESLQFEDASFDLVTCRIAPHHFPDQPQFVREVWRVLKPGGLFALVDNVAPDQTLLPTFDAAQLQAADQGYNAFEKIRDPSHFRALTTTEWLQLFKAVGFGVVHIEHQPKAMKFKTWCRTMAVPAPTEVTLERMLTAASPALAAFLRPQASHENGVGDFAFTLTELIAIGRKTA